MVAQNIIFYILAVVSIVGAFGVVRSTNVVHAALYLVVVLASGAGLFLLIAAEFLAWVQVLIYIGAVMVLLLFGIMLTRAPIGTTEDLDNANRWSALIVGAGLCGVLVALISNAFSAQDKITIGGSEALSTLENGRMAALSHSIMYSYVFSFEIVGLLLLAALIGAVVMARKD